MKLKTLVQRYLLIAGMAVSALVFVSMLVPLSAAVPVAANPTAAAAWVSAPTTCVGPDDGVICPQTMGVHAVSAPHSR